MLVWHGLGCPGHVVVGFAAGELCGPGKHQCHRARELTPGHCASTCYHHAMDSERRDKPKAVLLGMAASAA